MIDLYQNKHWTLKRIGELFNVSRSTISNNFKKLNVPINTSNHKYHAQYDIFKNIDSAEKAYWLGFIAADGCVYKREENASLILSISAKDKEHLIKFKKFMKTNANIQDFTQTEGFSNYSQMSKIVLNSKEMIEDLIKIGIVPRKSLILKPPKINQKYYLAFILGYFDGDGSIYKTGGNFGISLEGTKEILDWVKQQTNNDSKLCQRYLDSNKNNYYIRCGGTNKPYKIMKQLYDSSPVFLTRKHDIFLDLENVVLNRNIK